MERPSFEICRVGSIEVASYGVAIESMRGSALREAIAASTAARNSGLVAVRVSEEKMSVKAGARVRSAWRRGLTRLSR
jgi:hypothetical protein